MGIRQKFFCLIGVVGIILAVVSGVGYYIAYSHLSVSIENELRTIVEEEGLIIDRWLQQKGAVVTGAARQLQHLDPSVAESRAVLGLVDGDADGMDLVNGTESGLFMSWMEMCRRKVIRVRVRGIRRPRRRARRCSRRSTRVPAGLQLTS